MDPYGIRFPRLSFALRLLGDALSTTSLLIGSLSVIVRFPTGRRTSRRGLVVELLIAGALLGQLLSAVAPGIAASIESVASLPAFGAYPLAALDVALRYRHATAVERAQFRWLIAAASVTGVLVVLMLMFGSQIEALWSLWIASTILPTLAVGVAVLRYRLYDIDRIISRSLTYGAVSVVLFASSSPPTSCCSEPSARSWTATSSPRPVPRSWWRASSSPSADGSSGVVDRRFHRARYDADRTVDAFAGRLRDSVDLPRLVGDLRQTADGAVEPTSAAVWLRGWRDEAAGRAGPSLRWS